VEFVWALVVVLVGAPVGVTAALQWGKTRSKELDLQKVRFEIERGKLTLQLEEQQQNAQEAALDRAEREFALAMAQTPEATELKASELALKTAEQRTAAIEAEARAKYADKTAQVQAEADQVVITARKQALVMAAKEWAKSQPAPQRIKDPIESVNLESLYRIYMSNSVHQRVAIIPFGKWLGENYRKAVKSAGES
jgi:Tfp pilus assembly protein PilP